MAIFGAGLWASILAIFMLFLGRALGLNFGNFWFKLLKSRFLPESVKFDRIGQNFVQGRKKGQICRKIAFQIGQRASMARKLKKKLLDFGFF